MKEKPRVGKKKNDRVQMARSKRESELEEKLAMLTGEYERLRTDMVSTNMGAMGLIPDDDL